MTLNKPLSIFLTLFMLFSCSLNTLIEKKDVKIENKISKSIFLSPVTDENKTVFIKTTNTSGKENLNIESPVTENLKKKGYIIVNNPKKANFILQANILQAGRYNSESSSNIDAIIGATAGGAIGHMIGNGNSEGIILGAIAGFALGSMTNSLIEDVTILIVTDLQISENSPGSNNKSKNNLITHDAKILTYINQANLDYQEIEPELIKHLASTISGIF